MIMSIPRNDELYDFSATTTHQTQMTVLRQYSRVAYQKRNYLAVIYIFVVKKIM